MVRAGGSTTTVRLITAVRVSQRAVTCAWSGHTPAPQSAQTATAPAVWPSPAQSKQFTASALPLGGHGSWRSCARPPQPGGAAGKIGEGTIVPGDRGQRLRPQPVKGVAPGGL